MADDKVIDLERSVYALSSEYPEIVEIMKESGFRDIVKPGMLNTAGRFMTIPKGAMMKGIDLDRIKARFIEKGYEFISRRVMSADRQQRADAMRLSR